MKSFSAPSEERDDESRCEKALEAAKTAAVTRCRFVLLEDQADTFVTPRPVVDYFEDPYC